MMRATHRTMQCSGCSSTLIEVHCVDIAKHRTPQKVSLYLHMHWIEMKVFLTSSKTQTPCLDTKHSAFELFPVVPSHGRSNLSLFIGTTKFFYSLFQKLFISLIFTMFYVLEAQKLKEGNLLPLSDHFSWVGLKSVLFLICKCRIMFIEESTNCFVSPRTYFSQVNLKGS